MGRYFALTFNRPVPMFTPRAKKRSAEPTRAGIWPRFNIGTIVLTLVLALGLVYLFLVNSTSTKGYEIKQLEQQLITLKESQKKLEIESATLKSIQNIEQTVKILNLVPSGDVRYVKKPDYAFEN